MKRTIVLVLIVWALISKEAYANEERQVLKSKHYKETMDGIGADICIEDLSYSMTNTFSYESKLIQKNLSEVKYRETFETTNVWEVVTEASQNNDKLVLISDLWEVPEEMEEAKDKVLVVIVPFWSDDDEAVKHVEDVAWEKILPYWERSEIVVIYLDGFTEIHANFC